jgi:hypothetical protein
MTTQPGLFGAPREPAKAAPKAAKRPPLKAAMLERFKGHKYAAFSWATILKAYPERDPIHVERALRALIKGGEVKAMPAEGGKPVRYTCTIYKGGGLKK